MAKKTQSKQEILAQIETKKTNTKVSILKRRIEKYQKMIEKLEK